MVIQTIVEGGTVGPVTVGAGHHALDGVVVALIAQVPWEQSFGFVRHVGVDLSALVRASSAQTPACLLVPYGQSVQVDLDIGVVEAADARHGAKVLIVLFRPSQLKQRRAYAVP